MVHQTRAHHACAGQSVWQNHMHMLLLAGCDAVCFEHLQLQVHAHSGVHGMPDRDAWYGIDYRILNSAQGAASQARHLKRSSLTLPAKDTPPSFCLLSRSTYFLPCTFSAHNSVCLGLPRWVFPQCSRSNSGSPQCVMANCSYVCVLPRYNTSDLGSPQCMMASCSSVCVCVCVCVSPL